MSTSGRVYKEEINNENIVDETERRPGCDSLVLRERKASMSRIQNDHKVSVPARSGRYQTRVDGSALG